MLIICPAPRGVAGSRCPAFIATLPAAIGVIGILDPDPAAGVNGATIPAPGVNGAAPGAGVNGATPGAGVYGATPGVKGALPTMPGVVGWKVSRWKAAPGVRGMTGTGVPGARGVRGI